MPKISKLKGKLGHTCSMMGPQTSTMEERKQKVLLKRPERPNKTSDHSGKQEEGLCVLLQPRERCTDSVKEHFLKTFVMCA